MLTEKAVVLVQKWASRDSGVFDCSVRILEAGVSGSLHCTGNGRLLPSPVLFHVYLVPSLSYPRAIRKSVFLEGLLKIGVIGRPSDVHICGCCAQLRELGDLRLALRVTACEYVYRC